jgi:hypothetical protein
MPPLALNAQSQSIRSSLSRPRNASALIRRAPGLFTLAALAALAVLLTPSSARAQAGCKPLFDAIDKLTTLAHHAYSTQKSDEGKERTSETILIGNVIYVQVNNKWRKSPMTPEELRQQEKENRESAKNVSCKHVRDDSVGGEPAEVYSAHNENDTDIYDSQIWLSKRTGLVLREELDMDTGGEHGKSHSSVRYEYSNVSAPAVSPE